MKVAVVYYSGTGNTESMANAIQDELAGKTEVSVIAPENFGAADLENYDAFAFGCPAMGDEVLEESVFEPMFESIEDKLSGKNIILFGSYGWGDGEWMRNWEERCQNAGAVLKAEPVIANDAPDDDAIKALKESANALIG